MSIAVFIVVYLVVLTFAVGAVSAAPWIPTKKKQRKRLAELIPIEKGKTICDLGCGDGVVLFAFMKQHPGIKAIGYEIALLPFILGRIRQMFAGSFSRDMEIRYGNFFWEDLSGADVVFVFLLEKAFSKVMKKLEKDLNDGAIVIVEAWPFPGVTIMKEIREDELMPVYVYRIEDIREAMRR